MMQTIYLRDDATEFAELCDECLAEQTERLYGAPRVATVEGRLRRDADLGFHRCPRGHRIVVKRVRVAA